jgi:hypothetical protein
MTTAIIADDRQVQQATRAIAEARRTYTAGVLYTLYQEAVTHEEHLYALGQRAQIVADALGADLTLATEAAWHQACRVADLIEQDDLAAWETRYDAQQDWRLALRWTEGVG